jgi:probable F420-dependent oxidoreductase
MIRLGLNIPNFGPTATPELLEEWAHFAESSGFALGVLSDHVAPTPDIASLYPSPFYDAFATLSWLAGLTDRLELGTSVTILPYRHPLLTARMAANIDRFAHGRFILGVGSGWSEQEFTALGLRFRDRRAITDEYLLAIHDAWTNDIVSLDGHYVTYQDVSTGPRAARSPHPPIWVGGSGPAAIRRAARFGDAWHPINAEVAWLRDAGLPALQSDAAELGRPVPALWPRIRARLTPHDMPATERRIGFGSIAQILADIEALVELGSSCIVLDTNPDHPSGRRPPAEDFRTLDAIADQVRRRAPDAGHPLNQRRGRSG